MKFVIERGGVTWGERFYSGRSYVSPGPMFGPLTHAHQFESQSAAVRMSYRLDDEIGCGSTVVVLFSDFSEDMLEED